MADKGAHFFRCDFQVHTPRDLAWTGASRVTDEERRAYARDLVHACRDQALHGIAVTDHHDMVFVEYVRRAAAEETDEHGKILPKGNQLVVFPGIELTLGVPCQAIIVFDADFPDDMFPLALNALAIVPNPPTESRTAAINRLNHIQSLKQLKEELDKHAYLRERYIVLPNVSEGKFSLLRSGQAGKYVEMPWVGGFVDGDFNKVGKGNRGIIAGEVKEWGNKRIACFQTSDNRFEDHRLLGKFSTWIKWATPSAEALRQACLAQESRVTHALPLLPATAVASISVSNSGFLGPVDLELNPQYNALIGGRGTGKSTILEYLRWALCDQPPGLADEDTPNYQARRARLIEQTLKPFNGTVQIRMDVNGVPHIVRRNSQDGALLIKVGNDEMRPCTEDEVRTLLPIQAYSQKQLSDVSVRSEELVRFVTAPIRADLARIERQSVDRVARIRQLYATRLRQRSLAQAVSKRQLEQRSLEEQAASIQASLTGLSESDRTILDRGKASELADRSVQAWQGATATFRDELSAVLRTIDSYLAETDPPPVEPEGQAPREAYDEYRGLLTDAKAALEALVARADKILEPVALSGNASPWRVWADALAQIRTAYQAAVQRSSAHSDRMRQLAEIQESIAKHIRETARVSDELRSVATAEIAYAAERDGWVALLKERDDLLEAQCARLTESSLGAIRATIQRHAETADFVGTLRQALTGSRVPGGRIELLGASIATAADRQTQWNAVLGDLERLAEFDFERDGSDRRPDSPVLATAGITGADLDRIARGLKPEDWLTLSVTPPRSVPVFEYRAREADYIPFRNASAGQQATALLKTLLNQTGPPLVVDQPEEDLDNPVMLEVVHQVWQAKQKRQLIFASHNANLVVNGDAELVAWCDYRATGDQSRGTIAGEGAIDVPNVREAIKRIMEGGEAAFKLRREKYGF